MNNARRRPLIFSTEEGGDVSFGPPSKGTNPDPVYYEIKNNLEEAKNVRAGIGTIINKLQNYPTKRAEVEQLVRTGNHIEQAIQNTTANLELTHTGRMLADPSSLVLLGALGLALLNASK